MPRPVVFVLSAALLFGASASVAPNICWAQEQGAPYEAAHEPDPPPTTRPGLGFVISGWTTFGGSYLMSTAIHLAVTGADGEEWPQYIPLVGPMINGIIWAAKYTDSLSNAQLVIGIAETLVQGAGLALAILGHIRNARARSAVATRPSLMVTSGPGSSAGLGLMGFF